MSLTTVVKASEPSRRVLLERRLRRRSLKWVLRARAADPRARRDPDFIVAGAQKAASTSLYAYLAAHPDVVQPLVKEITYFDLRAARGHDWYRRHFPVARARPGDRRITGEASPMYMVHPLAMERIFRDLPEVKVVVILRNPLTRLLSHYRHSVRLEHEDLSLTDALEAEVGRVEPELRRLQTEPFAPAPSLLKHSYLLRSSYHGQVERIQQLFPERSMFLRLEDLTTPDTLAPLCEFLGIRFLPQVHFEAHNVNRAVATPDTASVPPHLLERMRVDAVATADLLGWEHWVL